MFPFFLDLETNEIVQGTEVICRVCDIFLFQKILFLSLAEACDLSAGR